MVAPGVVVVAVSVVVVSISTGHGEGTKGHDFPCLLYTSDAADD